MARAWAARNIVALVGETVGSRPGERRYKGFREVLENYPGMKIDIRVRDVDLTRAKGKSDEETGGAAMGTQMTSRFYAITTTGAGPRFTAVEEYGLTPGVGQSRLFRWTYPRRLLCACHWQA